MSAQFVIDVADDGTATLTVDGGEAQQFDSVTAACDAIEQMNGGEEPGENEEEQMAQGFNAARGSQAGMLGM